MSPVPYTVLVNPELTPLGDEMEEGWEGCLSVPGMRGLVPRYHRLRYQGFDQNGAPIDRTVEGFHARVVQHEVDHLDGILYPQRVLDLRNFGFEDGAGRPDDPNARLGTQVVGKNRVFGRRQRTRSRPQLFAANKLIGLL